MKESIAVWIWSDLVVVFLEHLTQRLALQNTNLVSKSWNMLFLKRVESGTLQLPNFSKKVLRLHDVAVQAELSSVLFFFFQRETKP